MSFGPHDPRRHETATFIDTRWRPSLSYPPTNRDLDTVLEPSRFFNAADVARDAVVLPYLGGEFFRRSYRRHTRTGTAQLRSAANTYVFRIPTCARPISTAACCRGRSRFRNSCRAPA